MIFGIQFFVNGSVCAGLFFFCGKGRNVKGTPVKGTPVRRVLPVAGASSGAGFSGRDGRVVKW